MAWMSNYIPLFYMDVITNSYPNPEAALDNLNEQSRFSGSTIIQSYVTGVFVNVICSVLVLDCAKVLCDGKVVENRIMFLKKSKGKTYIFEYECSFVCPAILTWNQSPSGAALYDIMYPIKHIYYLMYLYTSTFLCIRQLELHAHCK